MMSGSSAPPVTIDFFCIGAGKSGSTWLAQCLEEHPQITIAKNKEPNFFVRKLSAFGGETNREFMKNWAWYAEQFAHARPGDRLGDCSVNLMHNVEDAPKLIRELYPSAKLIVILRDPVQRTYSHYWHEKEHDLVPGVHDNFEDALGNKELLYRSRYGAQLELWCAQFPQESFFLICDFETEKDVGDVMRRLFQFLDVDDTFCPPSIGSRVNESAKVSVLLEPLRQIAKVARSIGLGRLLDVTGRLGLKDRIMNLLIRRRTYPHIKAETETWLRQEFANDIARLEQLFEIDLEAWKK